MFDLQRPTLSITLVAAALTWAAGNTTAWSQERRASATSDSDRAIADANRLSAAFSAVAQRLSPSVVSLRVEQRATRVQRLPFFFGPQGQGDDPIVEGAGSGVIIRPDGFILTNNHVVENATRVDVELHDGRRLTGQVVGTDPATDLAVVRVNETGLPAASFGDVDAARVGEWVVAIGSPFGLEYSVTTGVLSAKGRGGIGANEIEDYLQTDASINPGNSGGPLVNLRGEILGINTMIIGRGTGIGFAVPADIARNVADQLIDDGQVRRAWLGVGFQELTPELAGHFGGQTHGALLSSVARGGPARRAGLTAGDIIVSVDGRPVREGRDLLRHVLRKRVGDSVQVVLLRRGQRRSIAVQTAERPSQRSRRQPPRPRATPRVGNGPIGWNLAPITPRLARRVGRSKGVIVARVSDGTPAARAGLRRGDVIVRADQRSVDDPADVERAMSDGTALLHVARGDGMYFTVVTR